MTFIASCMIVIGIIFGVAGFSAGAELSIANTKDGIKVIKKEDRIKEEFSLPIFTNMKIDLRDTDIEIIPSNEYKLEIERLKWTEVSHEIENGTFVLTDEQKSAPVFLMNLSFTNIPNPLIKIYIPREAEFSVISLVNKFGDIRLDEMIVDKMEILSNDGDVSIKDLQSNELTIQNEFGDITGSNVKAVDLQVEMKDGDALFDSIVATTTVFNNKFGDITFRDFTSQGLTVKSNDGDIDIQGSLFGKSFINSSFGDINLKLSNKESELSYNIRSDFGDISVNDNKYENKATNQKNIDHQLDIVSKDGDVQVAF